MNAAERKALKEAIHKERLATAVVVPLETELLERIAYLERVLRSTQERCRRVAKQRDRQARRALKAERDAELLRSGMEILTR